MSLPPSPPCPLNLLPPELVQCIYDHIDVFDPETRRSTLLSLCLTSKPLRSFAQPLLLRNVIISYRSRRDSLKVLIENNSDESLGGLEVFCSDSSVRSTTGLEQLVQKATNLVEVCVQSQRFAEAFFGTNITTLSLSNIAFDSGKIQSFPQVTRFLMSSCRFWRGSEMDFVLPKLRHLCFTKFWDSDSLGAITFITQFAQQLVSLTTNILGIPYLPLRKFESSNLPILFVDIGEPSLEHVHHLELFLRDRNSCGSASIGGELVRLRAWIHLVQNSNHQLETITIATPKGIGGLFPNAAKLVRRLEAVCRSRNVRVIWAGLENCSTFDRFVPSSFVKMAEDSRR